MDMPTFKGSTLVIGFNARGEAFKHDSVSRSEAIAMLDSVLSRLKAEETRASIVEAATTTPLPGDSKIVSYA